MGLVKHRRLLAELGLVDHTYTEYTRYGAGATRESHSESSPLNKVDPALVDTLHTWLWYENGKVSTVDGGSYFGWCVAQPTDGSLRQS